MLKWFWNSMRNEDGLTLIELIVVVAIIAILAFTITPRVLDAMNTSRVNSARSVANELHATMERFYVNQGAVAGGVPTYPMPAADTWAGLVTALGAELAANNADQNMLATGFDYDSFTTQAVVAPAIANPAPANTIAQSYCLVFTARDRDGTEFRVTPAGVQEDATAAVTFACP